MTPHERQMIRDAVKEASEAAKTFRRRRSLEPTDLDGDDRAFAVSVERDSAEIFSNVLEAALRRVGAWIVFLE